MSGTPPLPPGIMNIYEPKYTDNKLDIWKAIDKRRDNDGNLLFTEDIDLLASDKKYPADPKKQGPYIKKKLKIKKDENELYVSILIHYLRDATGHPIKQEIAYLNLLYNNLLSADTPDKKKKELDDRIKFEEFKLKTPSGGNTGAMGATGAPRRTSAPDIGRATIGTTVSGASTARNSSVPNTSPRSNSVSGASPRRHASASGEGSSGNPDDNQRNTPQVSPREKLSMRSGPKVQKLKSLAAYIIPGNSQEKQKTITFEPGVFQRDIGQNSSQIVNKLVRMHNKEFRTYIPSYVNTYAERINMNPRHFIILKNDYYKMVFSTMHYEKLAYTSARETDINNIAKEISQVSNTEIRESVNRRAKVIAALDPALGLPPEYKKMTTHETSNMPIIEIKRDILTYLLGKIGFDNSDFLALKLTMELGDSIDFFIANLMAKMPIIAIISEHLGDLHIQESEIIQLLKKFAMVFDQEYLILIALILNSGYTFTDQFGFLISGANVNLDTKYVLEKRRDYRSLSGSEPLEYFTHRDWQNSPAILDTNELDLIGDLDNVESIHKRAQIVNLSSSPTHPDKNQSAMIDKIIKTVHSKQSSYPLCYLILKLLNSNGYIINNEITEYQIRKMLQNKEYDELKKISNDVEDAKNINSFEDFINKVFVIKLNIISKESVSKVIEEYTKAHEGEVIRTSKQLFDLFAKKPPNGHNLMNLLINGKHKFVHFSYVKMDDLDFYENMATFHNFLVDVTDFKYVDSLLDKFLNVIEANVNFYKSRGSTGHITPICMYLEKLESVPFGKIIDFVKKIKKKYSLENICRNELDKKQITIEIDEGQESYIEKSLQLTSSVGRSSSRYSSSTPGLATPRTPSNT